MAGVLGLSGVTACAPSVGRSVTTDEGVNFAFYSPQVLRIWIRNIGQFPDPKDVFFAFDCTTGRPDKPELVGNLARQNPGLIQGSYVVYKDYVFGCRDGHVYAKSKSLRRTLDAALGGMIESSSSGDMELLTASGYGYPNLELDPYSFHLTVQIKNGNVTAFDGRNGFKNSNQTSIVSLSQSGNVLELKNGNRVIPRSISPSHPTTLTYKFSGDSFVWSSITFNVTTGEIWAQEVTN